MERIEDPLSNVISVCSALLMDKMFRLCFLYKKLMIIIQL